MTSSPTALYPVSTPAQEEVDPEKDAAESQLFHARALAQKVLDYHRQQEAKSKTIDRFSRFPSHPRWEDALQAVLLDEVLDHSTAAFLLKELGRLGSPQHAVALLHLLETGGPIPPQAPASPSPGQASTSSPAKLFTQQPQDAVHADVASSSALPHQAAAVSGPSTSIASTSTAASSGHTGAGGPPHSPRVRWPPPDKFHYHAALVACTFQYHVPGALDVFESMKRRKVQPDVQAYNMVLSSLSLRGQVEEATAMLEDMRRHGVEPNTYTLLAYFQACNHKRRGLWHEAVKVLRSFLDLSGTTTADLDLDVVDPFLHVCEAAMNKAHSLSAAVEVFDVLHELDLGRDTRVYNAILKACAKRGQWRDSKRYFEEMARQEIPADTATFNHLIRSCVVGGALDEALEIFEWMVSGRNVLDAIPADIHTYNTLIRACHQAGLLEKALEIMAWVQRAGVEFDGTTYDELTATVEIAQLWDQKSMRRAGTDQLVVFPGQLRPSMYDGMRLMYLEHLPELEREEELAADKLGLKSWAASVLTRGSPQREHSGTSLPHIVVPPSPVNLSRPPSIHSNVMGSGGGFIDAFELPDGMNRMGSVVPGSTMSFSGGGASPGTAFMKQLSRQPSRSTTAQASGSPQRLLGHSTSQASNSGLPLTASPSFSAGVGVGHATAAATAGASHSPSRLSMTSAGALAGGSQMRPPSHPSNSSMLPDLLQQPVGAVQSVA